MKKSKKILIILLLIISLTGCTKVLKDKDGEPVINKETGQSMTENIVCKPTDKETIKIYEENNVDLSKLPDCSNMKISGEYENIWNSLFVRPLAFLIMKIRNLVSSSGLAIIIITLIIRLILYPITRKTAMQSENLKKAQPEIDKIEKKYKDKTDNESMAMKGQEMMMIYKKYDINPLSGCIFAFLQIPLLFAFLEAINRVPAIFEEKFLFFQMGTTPWIALKNGEWVYLILIILILLTTYFSFKMNQSTNTSKEMEKQNKMMMYFMVVFIGFMSFQLSSAVAVYWIISSIFTIGQNIITDKLMKNKR